MNFDFEITLLTVSAVDGVHFCAPVGHRQEDGDYRESRQPQQMSDGPRACPAIAREVVLALGGYGLFGVELFVCGDEVIFSEVSPRPHDTGMVTLISRISRNSPCTFAPSSATRRRYPPVWSGRLRGDPSAVVQPERQLWPAAVGRRGWPAAASVRQAGD